MKGYGLNGGHIPRGKRHYKQPLSPRDKRAMQELEKRDEEIRKSGPITTQSELPLTTPLKGAQMTRKHWNKGVMGKTLFGGRPPEPRKPPVD
jgi:hypothetical protein